MMTDPDITSAETPVDRMLCGLADVGRNPRTGGYSRFAWTHDDLALREWFLAEASVRGLTVEEDRAGNQFAWLGDPDDPSRTGRNIVIGSHLDSVPDGGAFDGPLGVISAFAALDRVRKGLDPRGPAVAVANFADEEGARFGVACLGSRTLTGQLPAERSLRLKDADGVALSEALAAAGRDPELFGSDEAAARRIGCFVELHIEQGLQLDRVNAAIGIGSGIWPHGRWRYDFTGAANHAGTTKILDRKDPMLPLARTIFGARQAAERLDALATVGRVQIRPNAVNAIPAEATAWLDARASDEPTLQDLLVAVTEAAQCEPTLESITASVEMDADLLKRIRHTLPGAPSLRTGAGHDAGILAQSGIPAAMLFVRNTTGISHSPHELASIRDCAEGVIALASVIEALARPDR
jgi:amidase, hydantoinase/carbamoylase family